MENQTITTNSNTEPPTIDVVQQIIAGRLRFAKRALLMLSILTIAALIGMIRSDSGSDNGYFLFAILAYAVIVGLYTLNKANYPNPKNSYRTWNKVVYIYLAQILMIASMLHILDNIRQSINPFDNFTGGHGQGPAEMTVENVIYGGAAYGLYKSLRPAKYIEAYYRTLLNNNTPTQPN